jgi:uncharacterized membrane protein
MQSDDHYEDFKPGWHDLEDQVGRNEALEIDLENAYATLRFQSLYWYAAALLCLFAVVGLGVVAFAPLRFGVGLMETYIGQTVVTTLLALALSAAVACFLHFIALRHLADETSRVRSTNQHMIMDARALLKERS